MHRDVKIGLILGVVLVAGIAALFFRREPVENNSLSFAPEQASIERSQVDRIVARRPVPPYLMPLEPLAKPKRPPAPPESLRQTSPVIPSPAADSEGVRPESTEGHSEGRPAWKPVPIVRPDQGPSTPTAAAPKPASRKLHRLKRGDTLYGLAERYLGDGKEYRLLFEVNRALLKTPHRLPVGLEIVIPESEDVAGLSDTAGANLAASTTSTLFQPEPGRRPRRYTVERGDTLIAIARRVYGDGRQYRRIYRANRDRMQSPDNLVEDMVLEIP